MNFKFLLVNGLIRHPQAAFRRFLPTFLDNASVFIFAKKARRGPLSMVWDFTDKCNLGCIFCDRGKINENEFNPEEKTLKLEEKIKIIRKLAKAGVWFLSFCGGEPLLCEELGLLIKEANARGMVVNVSTNGLLLEERAKMLVEAKVDSLTISIDSDKAELLNKIRGYPGLPEKIQRGIKAVRDLSKHRRIFIEARCLISKANAYGLEGFLDYWGKQVDSIMFKPIYENRNVFYKVPLEMWFSPEDEKGFKDYFLRFLKKHKIFNNEYNRLIPNFLFKDKALRRKYICFAGIFFGGIDCRGNLYPCHELTALPNRPLGNLIMDEFMNLWNAPEALSLRRCFKQRARCDCWMDRFTLSVYLQRLLLPIERLLKIFNHDPAEKI